MSLFRCISKLVFFIGFYNKVICSDNICKYNCKYNGKEEKLKVDCKIGFLYKFFGAKFSEDNFFLSIKTKLKNYENKNLSDDDINIIENSFSKKIFKKNKYWSLIFDVGSDSGKCKFKYKFESDNLSKEQQNKYIGFIKKRYIVDVTDEKGEVIGETISWICHYIIEEGLVSIDSCDIEEDDVVCTILIHDKKFVDPPKFTLDLKSFGNKDMEKAFKNLFNKKLKGRLEYGITQDEIDNEFANKLLTFRSDMEGFFMKKYFGFKECVYSYKKEKYKYSYGWSIKEEKEKKNSFIITFYFEGCPDKSGYAYQPISIFYRNYNIPLELVNENIFRYIQLIDDYDADKKENFNIIYVNRILKYIDKKINTYGGFIGKIIEIIDDIINKYRGLIEKFIKDYVYNKYDEIVKNTKNYEDCIYKEIINFLKSNEYSKKMKYILTKNIEDQNNYKSFKIDELNENNAEQIEAIKLISEDYVKKSIKNLQNKLINIINNYCKNELNISDIYNASVVSSDSLKQNIIENIKNFFKGKKYDIDDETINKVDYSSLFNKIIDSLKKDYIESKNLNNKNKDELKVDFVENKKEDDLNIILKDFKKFLKDKFIDDKYINAYKYDDFKNDYNSELLKSLSSIFVDEIIKYEKENVIDKISQVDIKKYISDLQNKKEEYNKNDTITSLLNAKKDNEKLKELTYKEEDENKLKNSLLKYVNEKLNEKEKGLIDKFITKQIEEINKLDTLEKCIEYYDKLNKNKDEGGSIKKLLKDELNSNNLKDDDIKDEDYKLTELETEFANKKKIIQDAEIAKLKKDDQDKLNEISKKIEDISNNIINEINKINTKDKCKNYKYKDNDSIKNRINDELPKSKIEKYDEFIKNIDKKNLIELGINKQIINIRNLYKTKFKEINVVKIEYVLVDEEKIEEKYKKEFNDFKNKAENKSFDSTKKYKELFDFIKIKNDKFKEIYLEESENNLISIQNNEDAIEKNNITINIKLVDSCYKKDEPKEEHEEDKNKDKHNEEDREHKDDNENNDKIKEEDIEDSKKGVKNKRCCGCYNNKNNKN